MNKKIGYKIIFALACIIFILCAIWLVVLLKPQKNNTNYDNPNYSGAEKGESENAKLPENPKDFDKLQKQNPDVYAWIEIPDEDEKGNPPIIDYPVVQAADDEDDNFYLDHNIDKNYEFAGMIYSQRKNSKDFLDPVTVLYGHNMLNGSMFAKLHEFKDKDFFDKHDTFYVYTPGHILTYTIVSAYIYDNRHILNTFDFSKKKDLKKYISSMTKPKSMVSNVRKNITVGLNDHILTLSTCTSADSQRYLVQGVLTNDQFTK